jgi:hypothetical protein
MREREIGGPIASFYSAPDWQICLMDSLTVDFGHFQTTQDHCIEWAVRACEGWSACSLIWAVCEVCATGLTASKESVELNQELDVWVIALCYLSVRVLNVVVVETGRAVSHVRVAHLPSVVFRSSTQKPSTASYSSAMPAQWLSSIVRQRSPSTRALT